MWVNEFSLQDITDKKKKKNSNTHSYLIEIWCSWAWDSILCWPPTKASTSAKHRCPRENGIDTTSKPFRT